MDGAIGADFGLWHFLTICGVLALLEEPIKAYFQAKAAVAKEEIRALRGEVAELRRELGEVRSLKERVEVLEDILTSDGYEVDRRLARLGSQEEPQTVRAPA